MIVLSLEVSFLLYESFSLKEKRSVVKSMLKKLHNRHNVSVAEIASLDVQNEAVIGLAVVGNKRKIGEQILQQCLNEIETNYPVEVTSVVWERE